MRTTRHVLEITTIYSGWILGVRGVIDEGFECKANSWDYGALEDF